MVGWRRKGGGGGEVGEGWEGVGGVGDEWQIHPLTSYRCRGAVLNAPLQRNNRLAVAWTRLPRANVEIER